ncbi:hypothetical protein XA68_11779 [Ophiocordyceps unilateralis]|uniref:Uncharacterized protein n=1 Tax=Ophiocordyceps unilateralis TaxID=268505 RepID=A0A2A9P225_OPHUN|nr:hypothetical protein XA68_11779 [Ophiocordyceps unilateralis]
MCAAEYTGCLAYNPFGSDGTLLEPTACSLGSAPTAAPGFGGSAPTDGVPNGGVSPDGLPSASASLTGSEAAPVVTAGGERIRPAAMAVVVIAGLALL